MKAYLETRIFSIASLRQIATGEPIDGSPNRVLNGQMNLPTQKLTAWTCRWSIALTG